MCKNKMGFGIINGVFQGYDHIKALSLAGGIYPEYSGFKVEFFQAYLNKDNIEDNVLLERIKNMVQEYGLNLITHLHNITSEESLDNIISVHKNILAHQKTKRTVIHHDTKFELGELIERFNYAGIIPYIENIHKGVVKRQENEKQEKFLNDILKHRKNKEFGAVLDFSRYFIMDEPHPDERERITGIILNTYRAFVGEKIPVFFHTIGSKTYTQERKDWTSPGGVEDVIPHREILKGIFSITPFSEGPLIVESEYVEDAVNGVKILRTICDELQQYFGERITNENRIQRDCEAEYN